VHRLLTTELARSYRVALGITEPGLHGRSITIRQVRYLLERIEARLATSQHRAPGLDEFDRQARSQALQNIADKILTATMPTHLPPPGEYALDATGIASWARGRRRTPINTATAPATDAGHEPSDDEISTATDDRVGVSFDPDAAWGYQTKTYDKGSSFVFGYQAVALARVGGRGPALVERLTLAPGNTNGVDHVLELVTTWQDAATAGGQPRITKLLCDRGFSDAVPERWKYPLTDLGIEQVIDIHPTMHGVRDFDGVKMIDGTPHCPAAPEDLWVIDRPANLSPGDFKANATFDEQRQHAERVRALEQFRAKIAQRHTYAFRRVQGPDAAGKERYECPAHVRDIGGVEPLRS
jgi:hypothetical protein